MTIEQRKFERVKKRSFHFEVCNNNECLFYSCMDALPSSCVSLCESACVYKSDCCCDSVRCLSFFFKKIIHLDLTAAGWSIFYSDQLSSSHSTLTGQFVSSYAEQVWLPTNNSPSNRSVSLLPLRRRRSTIFDENAPISCSVDVDWLKWLKWVCFDETALTATETLLGNSTKNQTTHLM